MLFNKAESSSFSKKARKTSKIRYIIIHYTGMQSKRASLKRLIDKKKKVSCHYLIDRSGKIYQLVNDNKVAWHAGESKWKNIKNLNENSIGIELVNKGHQFGYQKFPKIQIAPLIKLCLFLKRKYKIKKANILGHSDIAPFRKKDPGEKFPWLLLSKKKIGIWFPPMIKDFKQLNLSQRRKILFKNLYKIGYRYFSKAKPTAKDKLIIRAFQRKFLPNKVDGKVNEKTLIISHFLAKIANK